jgi:hypothetical protein
MDPQRDLLQPVQDVGQGSSGPNDVLALATLLARRYGFGLFKLEHQRDELLLGPVVSAIPAALRLPPSSTTQSGSQLN